MKKTYKELGPGTLELRTWTQYFELSKAKTKICGLDLFCSKRRDAVRRRIFKSPPGPRKLKP